MTTTHQMQYGVLSVGKFNGRRRQDIYVSHVDGERYAESAFATGSDDTSPRHDNNKNYDPKCSCCWLGFCHTENYHQQLLARHQRRET